MEVTITAFCLLAYQMCAKGTFHKFNHIYLQYSIAQEAEAEFLLLYTTTTHTSTIISITNVTTATPTADPIIKPVLFPPLVLPAAPAEVDDEVESTLAVNVVGTGNDIENVVVVIKSSDNDEDNVSDINVDVDDIDVDDVGIDDDVNSDVDDIGIDVDDT